MESKPILKSLALILTGMARIAYLMANELGIGSRNNMPAPAFAHQQSQQQLTPALQYPSRFVHHASVVGQAAHLQAGQKTKGQIKAAYDQGSCEARPSPPGNGKVGHHPQRLILSGAIYARNQRRYLRLIKAIEEEMGDDEVEWRLSECCRITFERIGVHKANLRARGKPPCGLVEHRPARIHRRDLKVRDSSYQLSKKAAVTVAIDKSAAAWDHLSYSQLSALLQIRAKA
jgi:hypothetical protein